MRLTGLRMVGAALSCPPMTEQKKTRTRRMARHAPDVGSKDDQDQQRASSLKTSEGEQEARREDLDDA